MSMSDAERVQRLALIHDTLADAERRCRASTYLDNFKATLALDATVEWTLLTIELLLPLPSVMPWREDKLIPRDVLWSRMRACVQAKGLRPPEVQDLLAQLYRLRISVQHVAAVRAYPQQFEDPVRRLVQFLFEEICEVRFDGFRPWSLIENESVRRWLEDASSALEGRDVVSAVATMEVVRDRLVAAVDGRPPSRPRLFMNRIAASRGQSDYSKVAQVVAAETETLDPRIARLETSVVMLGLGLTIPERHALDRGTRNVHVSQRGNGEFLVMAQPDLPTVEEALAALELLWRLAYTAQTQARDRVATITLPSEGMVTVMNDEGA